MGLSDCVKVESRHLASSAIDCGSLILMSDSLIGQLEFPDPGTHRDGTERYKSLQEGNLGGVRASSLGGSKAQIPCKIP